MSGIILLDAEPSFENGPDGELLIRRDQHVNDDMLTRARDMRHYEGREGEVMEVADIPTGVVEIWARQGFDIMRDRNIKAADILKRLHRDGLDAFITTRKSV